MYDPLSKRLEEVAVFRYGIIADLVHESRGSARIGDLLRDKAARSYAIPNSRRCRIAAETLRHWLKLYRRGGLDALRPRGRRDSGSTRSLPVEVVDLLCELKDAEPSLSVQMIISRMRSSGKVDADLPLPASTVHRLLSRAGLMRKPAAQPTDRRRFTFELANALWMSDVMHGPTVGVGAGGRTRRKSYLIGFIDDATRVVPFATFALSENAATFVPQLKQAIMRRGIPQRLYVDNGSAFRSHMLQLVCAKLGITLIHARPYHPEGKGKQERWFRTVRMQLLPTLRAADTSSLSALNARLWSFVEQEYHQTPHRGLGGITPLDAWAQKAVHVEHVGQRPDIDAMFMAEHRRKVTRDRTVSLAGTLYEVDASLVGSTVTLRLDPGDAAVPIAVIGEDGERHGDARVLDALANRHVKREGAQGIKFSITKERP